MGSLLNRHLCVCVFFVFFYRLKSLFPKQGSLKGCFRNVKAQNSHIDLKRMKSSGVSFGCNSDLLVRKNAEVKCGINSLLVN